MISVNMFRPRQIVAFADPEHGLSRLEISSEHGIVNLFAVSDRELTALAVCVMRAVARPGHTVDVL